MSATPPPTPPPATPPGAAFFNSVRRTGLVRTDERWIGGVAGGLARRFGIDPLLVRGALVLMTIFGGLGLVIYGLGWALLPEESDGRIHLQEAFRGHFDAALAGAIVFVVVGLSRPGFWFGGYGEFSWLWWLGVLGLVVIVLALLQERSRRGGGQPWTPPTPPPAGTVPPASGPPSAGPTAPGPAGPVPSGPVWTAAAPQAPVQPATARPEAVTVTLPPTAAPAAEDDVAPADPYAQSAATFLAAQDPYAPAADEPAAPTEVLEVPAEADPDRGVTELLATAAPDPTEVLDPSPDVEVTELLTTAEGTAADPSESLDTEIFAPVPSGDDEPSTVAEPTEVLGAVEPESPEGESPEGESPESESPEAEVTPSAEYAPPVWSATLEPQSPYALSTDPVARYQAPYESALASAPTAPVPTASAATAIEAPPVYSAVPAPARARTPWRETGPGWRMVVAAVALILLACGGVLTWWLQTGTTPVFPPVVMTGAAVLIVGLFVVICAVRGRRAGLLTLLGVPLGILGVFFGMASVASSRPPQAIAWGADQDMPGVYAAQVRVTEPADFELLTRESVRTVPSLDVDLSGALAAMAANPGMTISLERTEGGDTMILLPPDANVLVHVTGDNATVALTDLSLRVGTSRAPAWDPGDGTATYIIGAGGSVTAQGPTLSDDAPFVLEVNAPNGFVTINTDYSVEG